MFVGADTATSSRGGDDMAKMGEKQVRTGVILVAATNGRVLMEMRLHAGTSLSARQLPAHFPLPLHFFLHPLLIKLSSTLHLAVVVLSPTPQRSTFLTNIFTDN